MDKVIKVNFRNKEEREYLGALSLLEISEEFKKYFNFPILAAKVDNNIMELNDKLEHAADVDFYDRSSVIGNSIYSRGVQFLLIVAVKRVCGEASVKIEHSIDKGVYCELEGVSLDKNMLKKIEEEMRVIVSEDLKFTKLSVARLDAIKYFKKKKQKDKVNVLKYISNSFVNIYRLDDVYDYFFSDMPYSTRCLDEFKLTYIKDNGFVLSYPDIYNPEVTLNYTHRKMIFNTFLDYTEWGKTIGVSNASDLNQIVSTGKYNDLIRLSEAHYESQLAGIAEKIYQHKNKIKLVLIAGPSSSGKTTTAKKLEIYLRSRGFNTHGISIDDYFVDREKTPKNAYGEYDLESLNAVDIDLFNKHLTRLLEGDRVLIPEYNFVLGKREYKKKWLQMKENDIILIEGLHGLNEDLTPSVERNQKYKIYISPLTQLNIDNHNRIHTSDTRRLRRIIRDNKTRGYNAADTLRMWPRIREGEEKYIFPYQDDVDAIINSALAYELGVLKTYAEPLLFSVGEEDPIYPEALRLINFLRNFLPIPSDDIPRESVLREFIGGSCFK